MAYELEWCIDDAVILQRVNGTPASSQTHESSQKIFQMIDNSDRDLVHLLVNVSGVESFETSKLEDLIHDTRDMLEHKRIGWVIVFGQNSRIIRYLYSIVTQVFKVRFRMFDSADGAINFLLEQDTRLPDLSPNDIV